MTTLNKPNSQIIQQGTELYTIKYVMGRHTCVDKDNVIDKIKLGNMVKWVGGNHVVQHENKLIIVEKIQDATYESETKTGDEGDVNV